MLVRYSFKDLINKSYIIQKRQTKHVACFAKINDFLYQTKEFNNCEFSDYRLKIFIRHKDMLENHSNYKIPEQDLDWFVEYVKKKVNLDLKVNKGLVTSYIYFDFPMLTNNLNCALLKFYYHIVRLSYESFFSGNNIHYLKQIEERFPNLNIIDQYSILNTKVGRTGYSSTEDSYYISYKGHGLLPNYLNNYLSNDQFLENLKKYSTVKELYYTEDLFREIFNEDVLSSFYRGLDRDNFEEYLKKRNISYEEYKSICCWK